MGAILSKRRGRTTSTTTTTTTTTRPVRAEEKKGRGGNILKILLGICLLFLLGLSTILLIAAFATPWYKVDWEFESPIQGDDENCRVRYLIGWSTVHCKQEGCEDQFAGVQFCPGGDDNNFKWRSLFPATRNVYDVTVGLLAATLAAVLLMLILTMLFLCSKRARNTPYRLAFFGLGILAFFTLLFALIFFGVRINEAFAEDNWYFCNLLTSNIAGGNLQTLPRNVDTPCNSFIGDRSQPYLPSGEKFELTWGGVGYWLAFSAGVFFPLAACLALLPFGRKRERRPERVVEERRGEYREEVDTGRTYRREETITEAVPRV